MKRKGSRKRWLSLLGYLDNTMTKLRIFIACADERLRFALLLVLNQESGMTVVGITDRLPGLKIQVEATQPDVLLLEWEFSSQEMRTLLTTIRNCVSAPKVVYFSNHIEEEKPVFAAGVDYFIAKNAPPDSLLPILHGIYTDKSKNTSTPILRHQ
jgi:DNA-binding NarL/FixJ family response regulator